jgi:hypothetical protein
VNFVVFCRQIVSPIQQSTTTTREQVENQQIPGIPSATTQIPQTNYTYGELANAFLLQPGVTINNNTCMAIHEAANQVRDPVLGFQILVNFNYAFSGNNIDLQYIPGDRQNEIEYMRNLIGNSLSRYLERSDNASFRDAEKKRIMIQGILNAFEYGPTGDAEIPYYNWVFSFGTVRYSGFVGFGLVFRFLEHQSHEFQTLWAEIFVTDCIEAYDATLETYQYGNRISCGGGIIERSLMSISSILSTAGSTNEVTFTEEEFQASKVTRRNGLMNRWLQLYSQRLGDQEFTIDGFRGFVVEQIGAPDNQEDRVVGDWEPLINTFINSDGVRFMVGGEKRKRKRKRNIPTVTLKKRYVVIRSRRRSNPSFIKKIFLSTRKKRQTKKKNFIMLSRKTK